MNHRNVIGGVPSNIPSHRGWKARQAAAVSKMNARNSDVTMEGRRLRQFIHARDRAAAELSAARDRLAGLQANRDDLDAKIATLNAWAAQHGRIHRDAMQVTFAFSSAGPLIAQAEKDVADAIERLENAQERHDNAMRAADEHHDDTAKGNANAPSTDDASTGEGHAAERRGRGRPRVKGIAE